MLQSVQLFPPPFPPMKYVKYKFLENVKNPVKYKFFFSSRLINAAQISRDLHISWAQGVSGNWCKDAVYQCSHQRDLLYRQAVRRL